MDEGATMQAAHVTQDAIYGIREVMEETHEALMARVADERDREAFRSLFLHFGPRIKGMMLKAGAGHAEAEDLVQDVMMTVWRKVELYTPARGAASTWIFTIARNARIDRLRRNSSRPYDDIDDIELVSDDADAEQEMLSTQRALRVADALRELPREQREIVELAYMHDLVQADIADRLAIPLGTVKSRMRLAYAKLAEKLKELK
jgi:RNA polymerase sigma-70 factor (ECF subfamily)